MYESFYNFKAEPFRLSPDHRFCFTHKSYAKAKAYMQYAIHRAEGFVMVTGKPGTGKTTLVNDLVDGLSHSKMAVATIVSTQLEADDLLRLVSYDFGLDVDAPNKAVVLQGLSARLKRHHEAGTRALLIIDEAQDLSPSALEELRLLTNLQLNNQPLLQIFLVGQENLRDLVQKPSMEQVHQRLVAACHLESLNEEDTKAYIRHRLDRVGWKDDPIIDEGVYPLVFHFSKGVPRRINLICSRFLLHGSVEEKHRIRVSDVRTVVEELQNEQLAPIGFRNTLPPLIEEEEDAEPELQETGHKAEFPSSDEGVSTWEEEALTSVKEQQEENEVPEAQKTEIKDEPAQPTMDEDSLSVVSLEDQVRREEEGSTSGKQDDPVDMIQQDYFGLADAADIPTGPIPVPKINSPVPEAYGYGDRFAKAQRARVDQESSTFHYNEFKPATAGQPLPSRKRGVFALAFIFLLILGLLLTGLYLIRPAVLQEEIDYLERKFSHYLQDAPASTTQQSEPASRFDQQVVELTESGVPEQQLKLNPSQEAGTANKGLKTDKIADNPVLNDGRGSLTALAEVPHSETISGHALAESSSLEQSGAGSSADEPLNSIRSDILASNAPQQAGDPESTIGLPQIKKKINYRERI